MEALSKLSNNELDLKLKGLKAREDLAIADIILHLSELDLRKAYRELGYSSLFTYCTERLKYSEGSAYRRVQATRMFQTKPEVYDMLKTGKVTLSSISEVNKIPDEKLKYDVLSETIGKTQGEVKLLVATHSPTKELRREIIRAKKVEARKEGSLFQEPRAENKVSYNFQMEVSEEFMALYKEVRALIGHVPASEVFMRCMKDFKERKLSLKRKTDVKITSGSRFIPKATRLKVLMRDNQQCSYSGSDGRRCSERHALEFDHIIPFSKGGDNSEGNLRLLCRSHNQLMAERSFRRRKVNSFIL